MKLLIWYVLQTHIIKALKASCLSFIIYIHFICDVHYLPYCQTITLFLDSVFIVIILFLYISNAIITKIPKSRADVFVPMGWIYYGYTAVIIPLKFLFTTCQSHFSHSCSLYLWLVVGSALDCSGRLPDSRFTDWVSSPYVCKAAIDIKESYRMCTYGAVNKHFISLIFFLSSGEYWVLHPAFPGLAFAFIHLSVIESMSPVKMC